MCSCIGTACVPAWLAHSRKKLPSPAARQAVQAPYDTPLYATTKPPYAATTPTLTPPHLRILLGHHVIQGGGQARGAHVARPQLGAAPVRAPQLLPGGGAHAARGCGVENTAVVS